LCKEGCSLCSIHNPVEPVSQALGFLCCLRVSKFNFDAILQLQSSDELGENLTLRKGVDLHCQGCENGDVFEYLAMLPEVCPPILEATVFVEWRKVLFHGGTKCQPSQQCGCVPALVIGAKPKQGFGT
jgi:hypothetical protein